MKNLLSRILLIVVYDGNFTVHSPRYSDLLICMEMGEHNGANYTSKLREKHHAGF